MTTTRNLWQHHLLWGLGLGVAVVVCIQILTWLGLDLVSLAVHPCLQDLRLLGKQIPIGHNQMSQLALIQRPKSPIDTEQAGRSLRHRAQSLVGRQTALDGLAHRG